MRDRWEKEKMSQKCVFESEEEDLSGFKWADIGEDIFVMEQYEPNSKAHFEYR